MRMLTVARLAALVSLATLLMLPAACGEPAECEALVADLIKQLATECDVPSRCGLQADPTIEPPRVRYGPSWENKLREIDDAGCDSPALGAMPFFCNSGFPGCPNGYVCGDASFSSNVCLRR